MVLGPSGDDMLEGRERRRLSSCRGNEGERRTRDQVINSVVCRIIGGVGSNGAFAEVAFTLNLPLD